MLLLWSKINRMKVSMSENTIHLMNFLSINRLLNRTRTFGEIKIMFLINIKNNHTRTERYLHKNTTTLHGRSFLTNANVFSCFNKVSSFVRTLMEYFSCGDLTRKGFDTGILIPYTACIPIFHL